VTDVTELLLSDASLLQEGGYWTETGLTEGSAGAVKPTPASGHASHM